MLFSLDLVSPQARIAPLIHVSLIHCTRHPLPPRNHQRRWNRYFGVLKDQSLLLYSPAQHELQSLDDPVGGSREGGQACQSLRQRKKTVFERSWGS